MEKYIEGQIFILKEDRKIIIDDEERGTSKSYIVNYPRLPKGLSDYR